MDRGTTRLLTVALIIGAVLLGACSSSPSSGPPPTSPAGSGPAGKAPTNGLVQSNSAGNVTIEVKWLGTQNGSLSFQVDMNTHSVDLDQYDLAKLAVLRDDAGKEYAPNAWLSAPGGHHREGTLAFPMPEAVSQGRANTIQLIIRGVVGVGERVLQWQLG